MFNCVWIKINSSKGERLSRCSKKLFIKTSVGWLALASFTSSLKQADPAEIRFVIKS